jgi:hypothetical protein
LPEQWDESKILLLSAHIAKLKDKVLIHFNDKNEFVFAKFYYYHASSKGSAYNYNNILVFSKKGIYLTYDSKYLELPLFLYNAFDIYSKDSKYLVQLVDYTFDEIVRALTVAKNKMDFDKSKKSKMNQEKKLINSMKKFLD